MVVISLANTRLVSSNKKLTGYIVNNGIHLVILQPKSACVSQRAIWHQPVTKSLCSLWNYFEHKSVLVNKYNGIRVAPILPSMWYTARPAYGGRTYGSM